METASSVTTELTTCPICRDPFTNPKSLPCLHVFCLKCIEGVFRDKSPGNTASCPVCRQEFQIPSDGVGGLRHHFMVQQLLELNRHLQESSCNKHKDKEIELYCQCHDCKENICVRCLSIEHRSHNSVEIPEVADSFRPRINDDDKQIVSAISSVREQLEQTNQVAA